MGESEKLERGLGLVQATALNMIDMVGIGPFVVIPLVLRELGGAQSLAAWGAGALLSLLDGCVWAELGAAMPQAGGSYVYLREGYGAQGAGRFMSFLLIWQTLFQAPLVIASGALGFAEYSVFLTGKVGWAARIAKWLGPQWYEHGMAGAIVIVVVVLLYRNITEIGKISVAMWAVVLGTIAWLIWGGARHFDSGLFFAAHEQTHWLSLAFAAALGHASVRTIYTYLGYYNVCNLGGELKNPERNIPRAIFLSIAGISLLYLAMQTGILGVVPWREAAQSNFIVSTFVERIYGAGWASVATAMVLFIAFSSIFSATLGYSRIPYAAALDGNFFSAFGRLHPAKRFPYVSLLALGAAAFLFSLMLRLTFVIAAILAMRCVVQFVGQAVGLMRLRARGGRAAMPFRMPLYPLPVILVIAGWLAIFVATGARLMLAAAAVMMLGVVVYLMRARMLATWPFQEMAR